MKIVLETDRLILRHFVMDDLDDLYRIYTQPGTMRYIGSGRRARLCGSERLAATAMSK